MKYVEREKPITVKSIFKSVRCFSLSHLVQFCLIEGYELRENNNNNNNQMLFLLFLSLVAPVKLFGVVSESKNRRSELSLTGALKSSLFFSRFRNQSF